MVRRQVQAGNLQQEPDTHEKTIDGAGWWWRIVSTLFGSPQESRSSSHNYPPYPPRIPTPTEDAKWRHNQQHFAPRLQACSEKKHRVIYPSREVMHPPPPL